jgi:hypothetical protein
MTVQKLQASPISARATLGLRVFSSSRIGKLFVLFPMAVTLFILVVAPLSAGTKIVHRWVLTGQPMPKLKKILVIAVLENYLIRQHFEDEMEKLLAKSGVEGVKSHMVLSPRNELMEGELKQRIKESDWGGVLVAESW